MATMYSCSANGYLWCEKFDIPIIQQICLQATSAGTGGASFRPARNQILVCGFLIQFSCFVSLEIVFSLF